MRWEDQYGSCGNHAPQGNTVESCIITKWSKQKGDAVKVGDILFSYETDKAAFDEEAKVEGTLLDVFFQEGDDVPCLTNVCVIGAPGESTAEFNPNSAAPAAEEKKEEAAAPAPAAEAAAPAEEIAEPAVISGDLKISPRAKALAERTGADLSFVRPTGPDGRVIERDVQALLDAGHVVSAAARAAYAGGVEGTGLGGRVTLSDLAAKPAAASAPAAAAAAVEVGVPNDDSYTEPLPNIRKVIARTMHSSLANMAQLTHNITFDCTQIQALRKLFKEKGEEMGMNKVSLNDIVMYAVARTLTMPEHRALNANLIDDGKTMKYFNCVNLGMACDTDRGYTYIYYRQEAGQGVPRGPHQPGLPPGRLIHRLQRSVPMASRAFTPVINPPQTGHPRRERHHHPRARSERPDRGVPGHGPVAHLRPHRRAGWQPRLRASSRTSSTTWKTSHLLPGAGLMNGGTSNV